MNKITKFQLRAILDNKGIEMLIALIKPLMKWAKLNSELHQYK